MNATAPTTIARRPQPTDFKPLQELTVGEMLEDPRVRKAMAESAPRHLSPERLLRVMAQALRKTPKLAHCHPLSLLGAMITCASLGLEPNTPLGHAHLIPFEKRGKNAQGKWETQSIEINLIIGYQGLIDLSRRTGSLVSIHADVVYEGDEFSYEYGSHMHLKHVPSEESREGRRPIKAYAHAKLEDGEAFEVLSYAEVLRVRDATQAYKQAMIGKERGERNWSSTPWVAYEHEMVAKTMVRRLAKWLPKSIEFATALQMDSLAERGMIDFQAIAHHPALAADPDAAVREEEPAAEPRAAAPAPETKPTPPAPKATPAKAEAQKAPAPAPEPATASAEEPAPAQELSEEDEREADRLSRAAQEGEAPAADDHLADWSEYLTKMLNELAGAKNDADVKAVHATIKDSIVGAVTRKEISEPEGDTLLQQWANSSAKVTPKAPAPKGKK